MSLGAKGFPVAEPGFPVFGHEEVSDASPLQVFLSEMAAGGAVTAGRGWRAAGEERKVGLEAVSGFDCDFSFLSDFHRRLIR